jgi:hypothetical protein
MDVRVVLSADESLTNLIERLITAFTGNTQAPVVDMPAKARKKKEEPVEQAPTPVEPETVKQVIEESAKQEPSTDGKPITIDDIKALARTASVKNKAEVKRIVKEVFQLENIGDLPEQKFPEFIKEIEKIKAA